MRNDDHTQGLLPQRDELLASDTQADEPLDYWVGLAERRDNQQVEDDLTVRLDVLHGMTKKAQPLRPCRRSRRAWRLIGFAAEGRRADDAASVCTATASTP